MEEGREPAWGSGCSGVPDPGRRALAGSLPGACPFGEGHLNCLALPPEARQASPPAPLLPAVRELASSPPAGAGGVAEERSALRACSTAGQPGSLLQRPRGHGAPTSHISCGSATGSSGFGHTGVVALEPRRRGRALGPEAPLAAPGLQSPRERRNPPPSAPRRSARPEALERPRLGGHRRPASPPRRGHTRAQAALPGLLASRPAPAAPLSCT